MWEWQSNAVLHDCGHPIDVCSDPNKVWYPQRRICRPTMEQAAADRLYTELHDKRPFHDGTFRNFAERSSPAFPYHFQDGVTIFVATEDLAPDDGFLKATSAPPESLAEPQAG